MPAFSLTSDSELITRLRKGLTGYEDHPDDLPAPEMEAVLADAKSAIYTEFGITDFYRDHYTAQLLLYTTAIKAKIRVENYTVKRWSLGDETLTVPNANREDSSQMQHWNDEISEIIVEVPEAEDEKLGFAISSNYGWGSQ